MYRRRNPKTGKREGNWYISVKGVRETSGTSDREIAKAIEHKRNAEAVQRQHGLLIPGWKEAAVRWLDDNPGCETEINKRFLAFWGEHLKDRKIDIIAPKLIHSIIAQHFKVDLANPVPANSTANGYVGIVGRVLRQHNLNPRFTWYPKPAGRDRWLTLEEWRTLSAAMNPDLRDVSLFALATGLREANVMGLKWEWVKGDWLLIPGEFTKTDKPYGIPLNKTAQAITAGRRAATVRNPELVFLNAGKPWYRVILCRAFRKAVDASGIEVITFHGLRHTFASWLAQRGVDRTIRARLGCWAPQGQQDHYSHFDVESLRPFAGLIDEILAGASHSHQIASA